MRPGRGSKVCVLVKLFRIGVAVRGREIETHFTVHSQTSTHVRTVFQYTDFNLPAEKMSNFDFSEIFPNFPNFIFSKSFFCCQNRKTFRKTLHRSHNDFNLLYCSTVDSTNEFSIYQSTVVHTMRFQFIRAQ